MKRDKVIYIVVGICMAIAVILTVPVGIFRIEQISHNGGDALERTEGLGEDVIVSQLFTPQADYIRSISIDLHCNEGETPDGTLHFALRNAAGEEIVSRAYPLPAIANAGFYEIPIKHTVKAGEPYVWEIYMTDLEGCAPYLSCTPRGIVSPVENHTMTIAGQESESAAITRYIYGRRQGKVACLTYIAFILWAGAALTAFLKRVLSAQAHCSRE